MSEIKKPQLKTEELQRIFGMYMHSRAEMKRGNITEHLTAIQCISFNALERSKLWLKPIESMTDDQILELCKIADETTFGNYRFSKWTISKEIEKHKDGSTWTHYAYVTNKNASEVFEVDLVDGTVMVYEQKGPPITDGLPPSNPAYYQWHFVNSFAVPIYPFGETPIELGVAIDITKKK